MKFGLHTRANPNFYRPTRVDLSLRAKSRTNFRAPRAREMYLFSRWFIFAHLPFTLFLRVLIFAHLECTNLIFGLINEKQKQKNKKIVKTYFRADLFSRTPSLRAVFGTNFRAISRNFFLLREIARKFVRAKISTNKVWMKPCSL